jgi:hypothetical protein
MNVLRNVCVVHNLNGDALALANPQEGTGDFIAVTDGADDNLRGQLDQHGRNLEREIRRTPGGLGVGHRCHRILQGGRQLLEACRLPKRGPQLACPGRDHGSPSKPYKIPSLHAILIPTGDRSWLIRLQFLRYAGEATSSGIPVTCWLTASKGKKSMKTSF